MDLGPLAKQAPLRNASYVGSRDDLVIDPGPRTVQGPNKSGPAYRFDTGQFMNKPVYLGELRTDDAGRLLVLGGHGKSASSTGAKPTTFANNDGWHDDTSDGPVRATVWLGERRLEAEPAMIAVVPPNFGPGLHGVVTMYDVVLDLCYSQHKLQPPDMPSFWRHIFPLLERLVLLGHVDSGLFALFGAGSPSHLLEPELLRTLADPSESSRTARERLFRWFRDPQASKENPVGLPPFYGDAYGDYERVPQTGLSVTRTQYGWLKAWAEGRFTVTPEESAPPPSRLEELPLPEQPHALDRAHLEDCLGGPFHPGIELTWTLRLPQMWKDPFRLNVLPEGTVVRMDYGPVLDPQAALWPGKGPFEASGPGTLTWFMGVPWQTDEASCMSEYEYSPGVLLPLPTYWSARVPNQVLPERAWQRLSDGSLPLAQRFKHLNNRPEWLRFLSQQYQRRIANMVEKWDRMGIIAERPGPADAEQVGMPRSLWVETEVWAERAMEPPAPEALPEAGMRLFVTRAVPEVEPEKGHARLRLRRDEA
jgi:hypothetical protein